MIFSNFYYFLKIYVYIKIFKSSKVITKVKISKAIKKSSKNLCLHKIFESRKIVFVLNLILIFLKNYFLK